ncbi:MULTISPECIES: VanZ family protein [Micrococcaceae]|uniref:VanZ family protein n=1 Tax=unclassified Kocuria TaxID=2649579 RepID=UPI0010104006|nr:MULTISPECIES: VanZ family protein [unclassified Kocuria]
MSEPVFLPGIRQGLRHTGLMRPLRRLAVTVFAVLVLIAAVCFFWPNGAHIGQILINIWLFLTPTPWLREHISPASVEQGMNAIVFVPLTACLVLAFPRIRIWVWWIVAIFGSSFIEVFQYAFLPGRKFDPIDAVFNSVGGILGTAVGLALVWLIHKLWARNPETIQAQRSGPADGAAESYGPRNSRR